MEKDPQPRGNFLSKFPFGRVFSGAVPKDRIPALTDPNFATAPWRNPVYLRDTDLVLGVVINGETKAYPHNIGWRNEIVNDLVGEQPIVVNLCPLTSTGMVFDGQGQGGNRITTGVSGLLFNSNKITYDRRDNETLYPQILYRAVEGATVGDELKLLPVVETTWRYWKQLYPDTKVVSGSSIPYSRNVGSQTLTFANVDSPDPLYPSLLKDNETGRSFPAGQMLVLSYTGNPFQRR